MLLSFIDILGAEPPEYSGPVQNATNLREEFLDRNTF